MRRLGVLLKVGAVAAGVLLILGLLQDLLAFSAGLSPETPAAAGAAFGSIVGSVLRTAFLGVVSLGLWRKSAEVADPSLRTERLRSQLDQALASAGVLDPDGYRGDYADNSTDELLRVLDSIDRERVPERYLDLMLELRRRREGLDSAQG